MIQHLRRKHNDNFTSEAYRAMLDWLHKQYNYSPNFHVAETPVFLPDALRDDLIAACEDILEVVTREDFAERSRAAIPPGESVPNLIECQGFPSLYFFQYLLNKSYRKFFPVPEDYTCWFNGVDEAEYLAIFSKAILGDHAPENVILLEVDPVAQNTRIDFIVCCAELGIAEVCISDVELDGNKLYYVREGKRTQVKRIFNRVIFDELKERPDLKRTFNMIEEIDVEWAGHPNWFFLLSKYTLPMINSKFVPDTRFLHEVTELPTDLDDYVLKPLYSFAGAGVDLHPTADKIAAIEQPEHFILQKKVNYLPLVETLDDPARVEVRMMFVWPENEDQPRLINNLVRLSKGEMIGVKYNKNRTWVGGSLGYFQ